MNSVSSEVSNIKRIAEDARTKAANNESAISQCATKHELNTAASTYLTKTDAATTYLGISAKAADATKADSATKATQDASGNVITTTYATKAELNNVSVTAPKFKNVQASTWISDSTYSEFPYKCVLTCSGVTANDYAEVVFDVEQASSGTYAPVCETGTNTVTIWSSSDMAITIPAIIITK